MRALLMMAVVAAGCGGSDDATITGRVTQLSARRTAAGPGPRQVTHVMAVNPEASAPRRTLAAVDANGGFELSVEVGSPYVLVFVDAGAVGTDMVVGLFRAQTLDTLAPQLAAHLELGDVEVDPATQTATAAVPYDALIESLGLDPGAAELLGAVDDLSLRYANPDIDGDGVIDLIQHHDFALDIHARATVRRGPTGPAVTVSDLTDAFLPTSGPDAATPVFDLTSLYVLYPASYDGSSYVSAGPPSTALVNGAAFSAAPAQPPTSFSGLAFGDRRGWGPDYDLARDPALELPGSGGVPATLAYTLGASGTTLTFANVVTHPRAALGGPGTLMIFVRLVTDGSGQFRAIDFEWRKRDATGWVPASAEEIAVAISGDGGHISFHRAPSWSHEFGDPIPAQPSGSIPWRHEATGPADVCGLAVSFDDTLGMRHFVGGAQPDPGVSCSF